MIGSSKRSLVWIHYVEILRLSSSDRLRMTTRGVDGNGDHATVGGPHIVSEWVFGYGAGFGMWGGNK